MVMRSLFAILSLLLLFSSCSNNNDDNKKDDGIPAQVTEKFQAAFPQAQNSSWSDTSRFYAVDFLDKGVQKRLTYDRNARLLATETHVPVAELNPGILRFIEKNYPSYEIKKVIKKHRRDGTFFLVKIRKDGESLKLKFNEKGGFVNSISLGNDR